MKKILTQTKQSTLNTKTPGKQMSLQGNSIKKNTINTVSKPSVAKSVNTKSSLLKDAGSKGKIINIKQGEYKNQVNQKQEEKIVEVKEEKKQEEVIQKQEEVIVQEKPTYDISKVQVKYNIYDKWFESVNGMLYDSQIDEEYCFSFVFKGDYQIVLKDAITREVQQRDEKKKKFVGLGKEVVYNLEIIEDPIEAEKLNATSKPYVPVQQEDIKGNKKGVNIITNELKNMSIQEIEEKGEKYKQLIEARDLEDCLYN